VLELELCRGASDYVKPPLALLELIWFGWALGLLSWSLDPKFSPYSPAFHSSAGLAQSLVICINQRSTSPAPSYSCYWPGCGYLVGYSIKGGILTPMKATSNSCHSRYLNGNSLCPHFAARIPDSAHCFMGILQLHSLLVEFTDQIVWWRTGCSCLDFVSGFDANPPLGGFKAQVCSKVFWLTLWMWFSPGSWG